MTFRSFEPGRLSGVASGCIWLGERSLPVVVAINATDKLVTQVRHWSVRDNLAHLPAITDLVVASDGTAWVSAPSVGGLVHLETDHAEVVPLPIQPARLALGAQCCWAASGFSQSHPDDGGQVWRVNLRGAERVDLGGRSSRLATDGSSLYALVQRAIDIPFEKRHPGGVGTMHHPGALVRLTTDGEAQVVAEFEHLPEQIVWMSGHILVALHYELRVVDLVTGQLGAAVQLPDPTAPVGAPVDLGPHHLHELAVSPQAVWARTHDAQTRARQDGRIERVPWPWKDQSSIGKADEVIVEGYVTTMAATDDTLWCVRGLESTGQELIAVEMQSGRISRIELETIELWPYLPAPRPPRAMEPTIFAEQQRSVLEARLRQTSLTPPPWMFERVFVRKAFPFTELVAVWRTASEEQRRVSRSWRVFDNTGNPCFLLFASLSEDELAEARVFACPTCGVAITRPVELLDPPPAIPNESLGGGGADWVPVGRWLLASGSEDLDGGPIVNEQDLEGTRPHADGWRSIGCCGPDGSNGPNIVCLNGHDVATRFADCYQTHGACLLGNDTAVR